MHPAPSIIIFTVMSGLGYGLAVVLGLGLLDPAAIATKAAHGIALCLISGGLLSSTLHLGNPQRAWRALSQWRSSWLSREGVLALATFVPLLWSAWASIFNERYLALPGLVGALGALATVFCTSKIYASLKSIDAWHTPLTTVCYLLFSVSGGLVAGCLAAYLSGSANAVILALAAIAACLAAWFAKFRWRQRLSHVAPTSSPETATGLGGLGTVRLMEPPHMTDNYLTREMVFRIGRKHADKLFKLSVGAGAVLPSAALLLSVPAAVTGQTTIAAALALAGLVGHCLGLLTERWLFFAEARHAVSNYYGS